MQHAQVSSSILSDIHYIEFLERLHLIGEFNWYLEIGSEHGRSLNVANCNAVAVDPHFKIKQNVATDKPRLFLFQEESQEFFTRDFLFRNEIKFDFSFLDGSHLIEDLLRDFIEAERHSNTSGIVAIHDCYPYSADIAKRDRNSPQGAWTGDAWKIVPILRHFRPDLRITSFGCKPTGLILVDRLAPKSYELEHYFEAIMDDWLDVEVTQSSFAQLFSDSTFEHCGRFLDHWQDWRAIHEDE